ncbi:hypothetical protein [Veronia pacifica]|uniref:Uncharacterized protein n=1 Tax=Veronia pacifica TaxID=1080227 RepID=A0A1C3ED22_9GAMM|nr:hypothetical protein [Veronia pacifica]ODA31115.1 hypothetical protein A8L45_18235 [Veronia pacifica]
MNSHPNLIVKRKEIENIQSRLRDAIKDGKYAVAATILLALNDAQAEFESLFQELVINSGLNNLV